jgi:hypothetical protein
VWVVGVVGVLLLLLLLLVRRALPVNEFPSKSRVVSFFKLPIDAGNVPATSNVIVRFSLRV